MGGTPLGGVTTLGGVTVNDINWFSSGAVVGAPLTGTCGGRFQWGDGYGLGGFLGGLF